MSFPRVLGAVKWYPLILLGLASDLLWATKGLREGVARVVLWVQRWSAVESIAGGSCYLHVLVVSFSTAFLGIVRKFLSSKWEFTRSTWE